MAPKKTAPKKSTTPTEVVAEKPIIAAKAPAAPAKKVVPSKKAPASVTKKLETPAKKAAAPAPKAPAPAPKAAAPAKKAAAPAKKAAPAPAKKVAPAKKAAPAKKTSATTVVATVDVGFGNKLFIRGEGADLSWETGTEMTCSPSGDSWTWTTASLKGSAEFKLLINDSIWASGDNETVKSGSKLTISPVF